MLWIGKLIKIESNQFSMTSRAAFIFHGTGSDPSRHWFPWLKRKLEEHGYEVFVPKFPTLEGQNLENWLEVFEEYEDQIDENTVLIGHSTGAVFILDLLDLKDFKIEAAFLISGFIGSLGLEEYDPLNESFAERDFNWDSIRESCGEFHIFHSEDDPYVPPEKARELEEKLDAELFMKKDAGHFNTDSGYTEFPELLVRISI